MQLPKVRPMTVVRAVSNVGLLLRVKADEALAEMGPGKGGSFEISPSVAASAFDAIGSGLDKDLGSMCLLSEYERTSKEFRPNKLKQGFSFFGSIG